MKFGSHIKKAQKLAKLFSDNKIFNTETWCETKYLLYVCMNNAS